MRDTLPYSIHRWPVRWRTLNLERHAICPARNCTLPPPSTASRSTSIREAVHCDNDRGLLISHFGSSLSMHWSQSRGTPLEADAVGPILLVLQAVYAQHPLVLASAPFTKPVHVA